MAVKMYFVMTCITVALPALQAWVADDWNKYGVGYTSDDQINGMMWSQTYGYLLDSGYYGYSYYGCIVNQYLIIQTCSGPAVDIASVSYLTNLTRQGYFTSSVTSISIRFTSVQTIGKDVFANLTNLQTVTIFSCGNLENIDKDMFLHNSELQRLIIQGTKISLVPDLSRTNVTHVNLAGNAIKITTNNYRGWFFPSTLTHL